MGVPFVTWEAITHKGEKHDHQKTVFKKQVPVQGNLPGPKRDGKRGKTDACGG